MIMSLLIILRPTSVARYHLNNAQVYDLIAKAGPILGSNGDVFEPDSPYPRPSPSLCPYPTKVNCNPYAIYRTYDGTCNNLRYPLRGSSNKPLARLLPPLYGDGESHSPGLVWLLGF